MKVLNTILISFLVVAFFANYPILSAVFPNHLTDYYEFLDFYKARNEVYAAMFCLFFFMVMLNTKELVKSISKFAFIVSFGSVFDQLFLNVNWYLQSDVWLVIIAFELSFFQYYFYDGKVRRGL